MRSRSPRGVSGSEGRCEQPETARQLRGQNEPDWPTSSSGSPATAPVRPIAATVVFRGRSLTSLRCGSLKVFNGHSSTPHAEVGEAATKVRPVLAAAAATRATAITAATRQYVRALRRFSLLHYEGRAERPCGPA